MTGAIEEEQEVSRILFELSNSRRLRILYKLGDHQLRMQQIAKALDMNMTETFRHIERLSDTNLVEKKVDATYALTPLGYLATDFLSGFTFIHKNGDYFMHHDVTCLPLDFVHRIGELSGGQLDTDVLSNVNRLTRIIREAQEYRWGMVDLTLEFAVSKLIPSALSRGVKFKIILPQNLAAQRPAGATAQNFEVGYLPNLDATIALNEREALICFHRIDGKMDFTGFFGTDKTFHKWVKDLFNCYFERTQTYTDSTS